MVPMIMDTLQRLSRKGGPKKEMHSENMDRLLLLQALFTIIENSGLAFVRKWQVYECSSFFPAG